MCAKINSKYVENYATQFTHLVCDRYFSKKKYMTGQEILQLTPSQQVNFFVIKALFEAWQQELEKLKSNPFFDYRDKAVHDALKEFMNVLSRTIKIERAHFEPLLGEAVAFSIVLAIDPLAYYQSEFRKVSEDQLNAHLKDNKKYFKFHVNLIANLIDRAALGHSHQAYIAALVNNYEQQKGSLESYESLLKPLLEILPLDFTQLFVEEKASEPVKDEPKVEALIPTETTIELPQEEPVIKETVLEAPVVELVEEKKHEEAIMPSAGEPLEAEKEEEKVPFTPVTNGPLDPAQVWARYETEVFSVVKGAIKELAESVGINQRFMFTKELFDGNPDLLRHALKSIDQCESFVEAISLINQRYVNELKWDLNSDAVDEFLQLVFRKFDSRG